MSINKGLDKEDVIHTHIHAHTAEIIYVYIHIHIMEDVRYMYVCIHTHTHTHTHTYNGILLSHKNNEIMPSAAATRTDLEVIILSDISQRQRQISYRLDVESKKMIQMNLFTKQKETDRHRKQTYSYQRGKGQGGIN